MSIKRKIYYISALLCVSLLLSACSGKESSETTAEIKENSTAETTEITTEASIDEGVQRIGETETESETKATIIINGKKVSCAKFDRNNYLEILELVIEKGNDWTDLPLSDKFRENYKPEEGLLERKDYTYLNLYHDYERNFSNGQLELIAFYSEPKYIDVYFDVYFTVNDKEQLDTIELKFDKEEERDMRGERPITPLYMDEEDYTNPVIALTQRGIGSDIELFALTESFRKYYKPYLETGLLPDPDYDKYIPIFELCNYDEKKVVFDVVYGDKIIRYNAYFTTDEELRLDSITLEEESVREREPETESKSE